MSPAYTAAILPGVDLDWVTRGNVLDLQLHPEVATVSVVGGQDALGNPSDALRELGRKLRTYCEETDDGFLFIGLASNLPEGDVTVKLPDGEESLPDGTTRPKFMVLRIATGGARRTVPLTRRRLTVFGGPFRDITTDITPLQDEAERQAEEPEPARPNGAGNGHDREPLPFENEREPEAELEPALDAPWAGDDLQVSPSITVFTSKRGLLCKVFEAGPDGSIIKASAATFFSGTAHQVDILDRSPVGALEALAEQLQRLTDRQALGLGVASNGRASNVIITEKVKQKGGDPDAITRSLRCFEYRDQPGFLLIDADGEVGLRDKLIALYPPIAAAASLTVPSSSAGIWNRTSGQAYPGGGEHLYLLVDDASRSREALSALHRLAWMAGRGRLIVSGSGALLSRSLIDVAVGSPERLVFEAKPKVTPPIEDRADRTPQLDPGSGGMVAVADLVAYADQIAPVDKVKALHTAAAQDPALQAEQTRQHEAFLGRLRANKIGSGADAKTADAEAAAARAAFRPGRFQPVSRLTLTANDIFITDDGERILLQDVLDNPEKFNGITGPDPAEGESYGKGKAMIMSVGQKGPPHIRSHAHGLTLYDIVAAAPKPERDRPKTGGPLSELEHKRFEPLRWVAEPILIEGCTILSGNPKLGKSFKALQIALGVSRAEPAFEGSPPCPKGSVLFLALEENERRMQRRVTKLIGLGDWPENMHVEYEWPRAHEGGLDKIRQWIADHPDARLVVIDILGMFRKPVSGRDNTYQADAEAMRGIQQIATDTRVAILVVHHNRKTGAEGGDPFELVSGSMGLTGSVDAVLIMRREAGIVTLYGRGRDFDGDIELGIEFDRDTARWSILGNVDDVKRSETQTAILDVLGQSPSPLSAKAISDQTEKNYATIRSQIAKMLNAAQPLIRKAGNGYTLAGKIVEPDSGADYRKRRDG